MSNRGLRLTLLAVDVTSAMFKVTSSKPAHARKALPNGYRQGIITAITVFLAFTVAFFRYWGFEAKGRWGLISIVAAAFFFMAIIGQSVALFRSWRIDDDDEPEYQKTVIWLLCSVISMIIGLIIAVFVTD